MGIIGPTAPSGPAGGSLSGTYPNPGVANEVIGANQIQSDGVLPAKPAEKAVSAVKISGSRKAIFAITGDGALKKWSCKHSLTSWTTNVAAYEKGGTEAQTKTNLKIVSWTHLSNQEVEVELEAAVAVGTIAFIAVWA